MDKDRDENYLNKILDFQKKIPDIVLPSMGLINNNNDVSINCSDFFKDSGSKEDYNEVK